CEVGLDSQIGRQRFISLLFLLRARRVTGGKRTSTIRISPFLPQSGPNACAQRNETGAPETTSNTLSIATSHQPRVSLSVARRLLQVVAGSVTTPSVPTLGRATEEAGQRAGQLLEVLDEVAQPKVKQA